MTVLEKFRQQSEADRAAADAAWSALVSKLASSGKAASKLSHQEIDDVRKAAGKSLDDLERAVATEKRCIELRERARQRPAAIRRVRKAEQDAAEFNKRLQRTNQEMIAEGQKFQGEARVARSELQQIDAAVSELEKITGEAFVWPDAEAEAA